jgi:hypothetical protein
VNPRVGLEDVEMRIFLLYWDSNPDPSVIQHAASRYTDYVIPASYKDILSSVPPDILPLRIHLATEIFQKTSALTVSVRYPSKRKESSAVENCK